MATMVVGGEETGKDVEWAFAVNVKTMITADGKSIITTGLKPGMSREAT